MLLYTYIFDLSFNKGYSFYNLSVQCGGEENAGPYLCGLRCHVKAQTFNQKSI